MSEWTLRSGGAGDLDAINRHVQAGFDFYAGFAPPGWQAPRVADESQRTQVRLADPGTWVRIAQIGAETAGHVSFFPGRERTPGPDADWSTLSLVPGLAHLWHLFVLEPWWGSGVADALHAAAVQAMHEQGFARARLYTPTSHTRARRFYERRGWVAQVDAFHEGLGLVLTEYALGLPA